MPPLEEFIAAIRDVAEVLPLAENGELLQGDGRSFQLYGPTCDATDVLPGRIELPADIQPGDYLEFGCIGAYSLSGRTTFNGHYSDRIVTLTGQ